MAVKNAKRSDAIPVSVALDTSDSVDALQAKKEIVDKRVFYLSVQAILNAITVGFIAKVLVLLINFITNLSFYGRFSITASAPTGHHLGIFVIIVPVIGGLVVGLMARYGS